MPFREKSAPFAKHLNIEHPCLQKRIDEVEVLRPVGTELGDGQVMRLQEAGSSRVPGLPAKPILDILLVAEDLTAEEDYLPQLEAAGYPLRIREPGHRMARTPQRDVHVHVLEQDDEQIGKYLLFRDHLRRDESDRDLYARTKRELAARDWPHMNAYADAKTDVIVRIKDRARRSS